MSTTKDILKNTIYIEILPTTTLDVDINEDRNVELEQVYIINDDTFDNNVVQDDGGFKDSNTV